jgi:hypothetical protein
MYRIRGQQNPVLGGHSLSKGISTEYISISI